MFTFHTDSVRRKNFNEMAINARKEDIVKIENHCTKKIKLGYLEYATKRAKYNNDFKIVFVHTFV